MQSIDFKIILPMVTFLVGIAAWSLKGWVTERLVKRRATDQLITLGELDVYCRRKHDSEKIYRESEIKHLRESLEKDLQHNSSRLKKLESVIYGHGGLLKNISESIAVIAKREG
ncbi:hypothetical protein KAR91_75260 [Candidatus Pacearchaeota archaeon]|nr:hypothetical protein [Candidatus Pacearchaeota archaeon]